MNATSAAAVETMDEKQKARADAIMHGWLEFNAKARSIEDAYNAKVAEISRFARVAALPER